MFVNKLSGTLQTMNIVSSRQTSLVAISSLSKMTSSGYTLVNNVQDVCM